MTVARAVVVAVAFGVWSYTTVAWHRWRRRIGADVAAIRAQLDRDDGPPDPGRPLE